MKPNTQRTLRQTTGACALAAIILISPAHAADPETAPDDTWITVSGTVTTVSPDTFKLDYGGGVILIEMDDWDADADAYKVVEGDRVTVTGKVDDDLFEKRSIEASSVYVQDLNTYFYASAADEEDVIVTVSTPIVLSQTVLRGTVTEIPKDDEFVIDTGLRKITVETEEMAYNPLDDEGYQKIKKGDRVSVYGKMDYDFLEGRELVADHIVTLSKNGGS